MVTLTWDVNITDVISITISLISLIISIFVATGIIGIKNKTEESSNRLNTINENLGTYNKYLRSIYTGKNPENTI